MDGYFSHIASMDMGWDELKFALVGGNSTLEGLACFIEHDVDCGHSFYRVKACMHVIVCMNSMTVMFGYKWVHKDGI